MMMLGVFFAIQTWNVSSEYTEARPMAIAVSNIVFVDAIITILVTLVGVNEALEKPLVWVVGATHVTKHTPHAMAAPHMYPPPLSFCGPGGVWQHVVRSSCSDCRVRAAPCWVLPAWR